MSQLPDPSGNAPDKSAAEVAAKPKPSKSFLRTVLAVAWSLLGVRKGTEFEEDLATITPLHVIFVGLVAIFLLVIGLIVLVKLIV